MTISNAQRVERRMWIGSSDVAAICGVDTFKSITDVWYSKVFVADEWKGNAYTEAGDYAEEGLVCYAEDQLGVPRGTALRNAQFKKDEGTPFAANLDGYLPDQGIVIEAKSTGMKEDWGAVNTDQVPDKVLFQVHHQMYCSGARSAVVPCLLGYRGLRYMLYRVDWNQEIADFMLSKCQRFWHENVLAKSKPEGPVPRLDTLKLLHREQEETVELEQGLVDRWNEARAAMSEWRKEKEKLDREILSALEVRQERADGSAEVRLADIGLAKDGYIDYSCGPRGRRSLKWKAEPWSERSS